MKYGSLQEILQVSPGVLLGESADLMIGRVDSNGDYAETEVSEVRIAFDYSSNESTPKMKLIFVEE